VAGVFGNTCLPACGLLLLLLCPVDRLMEEVILLVEAVLAVCPAALRLFEGADFVHPSKRRW
jgi:hypothetical protein